MKGKMRVALNVHKRGDSKKNNESNKKKQFKKGCQV
jgi:hypothetical protein